MEQKIVERKVNIYIAALLFMLLFSYVICAVWKSPAVTGERLLDVPASYTINSEYLYSAGNGISYQQDTKEFLIQADYAEKSVLFLFNKADIWNYLKMDISEMNCESINIDLTFLFEGQACGEQSVTLKKGENVFQLQEGMLFDEIRMAFSGQNGKSFHITRFTISEAIEGFDWEMFMKDYVKVLFVMFSVSCAAYLIWKKKYFVEEGKYVRSAGAGRTRIIQNEIEKLMPRLRFKENTRSIMRRMLFVWIFCVDFCLYKISMRSYYREALLLTGLGLVMISLLAWQEERQERKMDACMVGVWAVLQFLEIFSDIIVPKELRFMGLWQLCVLGSFFWIWGGMKKPEKLLQDFKSAVHILYMAMIIYCIFFYSCIPELGQRYTGPFHNSNPFSLACMLGVVVAASDLAGAYGRKWARCAWYGIEIAVGVWLIWKSECRTALLTLAVFFFLLIVLSAFRWSEGRKKSVKLFLWGGLVIFFLFSLLLGVYVMKYVYQRPIDMTSLDSLTSGRMHIWGQYIQNWNIWGHKEQAVINGNPTYAHNGLLRCMNYYGVFSGIAYILLAVNCILRLADVYVRRKVNIGAGILLSGVIISFFVATMLESLEDIPFIWPNWLAFYWIIGALMIDWKNVEGKEREIT